MKSCLFVCFVLVLFVHVSIDLLAPALCDLAQQRGKPSCSTARSSARHVPRLQGWIGGEFVCMTATRLGKTRCLSDETGVLLVDLPW
jgi:hypothetical protein